ncbi:leucyl aminopeptidase family protein [Sphingorhabdus soli]|uniref:Leucyl aminopeptidase family protein n=1 Tax=Flavisphingopyxis soli TaxID=2601267 RepID=A0A5C6U732_9SPHN|nr:leucyl aminopeptidase family protein [Sphingorhabdus soli]TXC68230.1 leucyl aminopeptidase family protein [Sphingorhabdus soli]
MTEFNELVRPDKGEDAHLIHIVDEKTYDGWLKDQPPRVRAALAAQQLQPKGYANAILPGEKHDDWAVVTVVANVDSLSSWCLAKLPTALPAGTYRLANGTPGPAPFGWMIAQHRFDRYKKPDDKADLGARVLLTSEPGKVAGIAREAKATALVRDLVNTPAADMGPADLEAVARRIAKAHDADLTVTADSDLAKHYPMIHAVGRAAGKRHAPRLIEIEWGNPKHPRVAIVGKGVTFDSGGLDIKGASGMRLMKKDMGGAAHALALAEMIIEARLPVRLHMLVAAVENAISEDAFRPGDILTSRKGLTVEIGNTDAEGRLVLGDALTRASEDSPELMIDFATLTGAARVALGPDLPNLFCDDDTLANDLLAGGTDHDDPCWRMPLWDGYAEMLSSDIADISNATEGGFAGSVTAALFLKKFVGEDIAWAHFDTFAWQPVAKPGRPKGGAALGLRAAWAMLNARYPRD